MLSYLEKGWNYVTGSSTTVNHPLYGASTSRSLSGDLTGLASRAGDVFDTIGDRAESFLTSDLGSKVAGTAAKSLFGESGTPKFGAPSAGRVRAPRTSVSSGAYQATPVDLGYTAKVQNAMRVAQNARAGSPVGQTIQRLQTKPAKGPLLQVAQSNIRVAPRSRG